MRINCNLITSNLRTSAIVTGTVVLCGALWGIPSAVAAAVTLGTTFYTQRKTQEFEEKPLLIATKEIETQTDPLINKDTQTVPTVIESDEKQPPITAKVIETQTDPLVEKDVQTPPTIIGSDLQAPLIKEKTTVTQTDQPKDNKPGVSESDEKNKDLSDDEDYEQVEKPSQPAESTQTTSIHALPKLKPFQVELEPFQKAGICVCLQILANGIKAAYTYLDLITFYADNSNITERPLNKVHPLQYIKFVYEFNNLPDLEIQKISDYLQYYIKPWLTSNNIKLNGLNKQFDDKIPPFTLVDGRLVRPDLKSIFKTIVNGGGLNMISSRFKGEMTKKLNQIYGRENPPLDHFEGFAEAIGRKDLDQAIKKAVSEKDWLKFLKLVIS